jgi:hypothetical protein
MSLAFTPDALAACPMFMASFPGQVLWGFPAPEVRAFRTAPTGQCHDWIRHRRAERSFPVVSCCPYRWTFQ